MQGKFTAHTKYNDYKGSVAADNHDNYSVVGLFEDAKLLSKDQRVIGINAGSGNPTPRGEVESVSICAYVVADKTTDDQIRSALNRSDDSVVKKLELQITPSKFFALFKRFDLAMSRDSVLNGLPLYYHEDEEA